MSYEKQNFQSGQILKAEHLNHMEDGIEQISEDISVKISLPVIGSIADNGATGQFAVSDGKGGITWKTLVEAEAVMY